MARAFLVVSKAANELDRVYVLHDDKLVLLQNHHIRIELDAKRALTDVIKQYERETWPSQQPEKEVLEAEIDVGAYFKSIARPTDLQQHNLFNPLAKDENEVAKRYMREHDSIARDIEGCFDVVSPAVENYESFGIQFEKIIYFCCVGVEGLFKKLLTDNNLSTKDVGTDTFFKLKPFLRINEYQLSFVRYPWLPALSPFSEWNAEQPSKSLPWFGAYNALKHDKQNNLHRATMKNALQAAAGYYALTYAIFGGQMFYGFLSDQFFLNFDVRPHWQVTELYFPPIGTDLWRAKTLTI